MNPDDILRFAERARARGVTTEQINARIGEMDVPFSNLVQVRAAAEHTAGGEVPGGTAGATGRAAARGLSFGFLDELSGLAAGAGAAVVPGGEGFGEARRRVQEESRGRAAADRQQAGGVLSTAGEIAGSIPTGGALARGVFALPRFGNAAKGALSGLLEGGLFGAGQGETPRERAVGGGVGAAGGGMAGGILGKVAGKSVEGAAASAAKDQAGVRLAQAGRRTSGVEGRPSGILDEIEEAKRVTRQELAEPLEALGREDIPAEVGETIMGNRLLREEARRVAPEVFEGLEEGAVPRFTFDELDTLARSIRNDASAFQRAAGGDLPTNVRPVNVKRAEGALDELDDVMGKHLEDFPEFRARWGRLKAQGRALTDGRRAWNENAADLVEREFSRLGSDAERRAYREGLMTEMGSWLESLSEPVAALRRLTGDPGMQRKLQVLMGEEGAERFQQAAQDEKFIRQLAQDHEARLRVLRRFVPGGDLIIGAAERAPTGPTVGGGIGASGGASGEVGSTAGGILGGE